MDSHRFIVIIAVFIMVSMTTVFGCMFCIRMLYRKGNRPVSHSSQLASDSQRRFFLIMKAEDGMYLMC